VSLGIRIRGSSERLLVDDPAEHGRHPGAFVQAECAGLVRRVDTEPDASFTTLPEAPERVVQECCPDASLSPRAPCEEHVDPPAAVRVGRADRSGGDLAPGTDDAPERRVEALAGVVALRPRFESAGRVVPVILERLLVRGVELQRVVLCVKRGDPQSVRPHQCRRGRDELDAQLTEDAHGVVAERLEQPVSGGVGFEDAVLDSARAAACSVLLESCCDQLPDPAPGHVGMDVPFRAPQLATLSNRAVADDATVVAHDVRVLREVELRPFVLQILLRVTAFPIQGRLERTDELGHRGRVSGFRTREDCARHAAI
jgi:hypothetical protein